MTNAEVLKVQAEEARIALRDQFATAALTGLVSFHNSNPWDRDKGQTEDYAKRAYEFADAMLKARERKVYSVPENSCTREKCNEDEHE